MTETARTAHAVSYRVAYVTRGLPHYRLPFIQALADADIQCDVFLAGHLRDGFIEPASARTAGLTVTILRRTIPRWRADVLRAVRKASSAFILLEHGASLDFTWSLLLSRQLAGVPRILWTHGIERRELYTGSRSASSLGRWWQLSLCDAILCYDQAMAERLRQRFPHKVIGFAPNSTIGTPLLDARRELGVEGRLNVRRRHGLDHKYYILGLGRLVKEKEFHRLIGILRLVRQAGLDAGALFVGTGPEVQRIRKLAALSALKEGSDIVFAGALSEPTVLAEWLYCADVCVNPGYLGLSVVDCLFSGLPVVSCVPSLRGPHHSPEWQYLTRNVTGWLVDENSDEALAAETIRYLSQPVSARRNSEEACMTYAASKLGILPMVHGLLAVLHRLTEQAAQRQNGHSIGAP